MHDCLFFFSTDKFAWNFFFFWFNFYFANLRNFFFVYSNFTFPEIEFFLFDLHILNKKKTLENASSDVALMACKTLLNFNFLYFFFVRAKAKSHPRDQRWERERERIKLADMTCTTWTWDSALIRFAARRAHKKPFCSFLTHINIYVYLTLCAKKKKFFTEIVDLILLVWTCNEIHTFQQQIHKYYIPQKVRVDPNFFFIFTKVHRYATWTCCNWNYVFLFSSKYEKLKNINNNFTICLKHVFGSLSTWTDSFCFSTSGRYKIEGKFYVKEDREKDIRREQLRERIIECHFS